MAGSTVSFIAGPVEHIKARLQVQYAADKRQRMYQGPIDCVKKIVRYNIPTKGDLSDANYWFSSERTASPESFAASAQH